MLNAALNVLICLIPVIVLWSGMAMTPMLVVMVVLIALSTPRSGYSNFKAKLIEYKEIIILLGLFSAWPLVTALWSIDPERSVGGTMRVLSSGAMGLFAFILVPSLKKPSEKTLRFYAYGVLLSSVIVLLEKLPNGGLIHYIFTHNGGDYQRFIDKNINRGLCALVVLVWPLMAGLYALGRKRFAWLVAAVLFAAVMSMHSLSAKVGFMTAGAVFVAIRLLPVWSPRLLIVAVPAFLLAFPVVFMAFEHTVFADPTVREHLPLSSIQRLNIWHELLIQVKDRPVTGWGMDTSRMVPVSDFGRNELGWTAPPLHPHSPSLQLLLELGLVGLLTSCAILAKAIAVWERRSRGQDQQRMMTGAMIGGYFITGMSSFGIWQSWWVATLWMVIVLMRYMSHPAAESKA